MWSLDQYGIGSRGYRTVPEPRGSEVDWISMGTKRDHAVGGG